MTVLAPALVADAFRQDEWKLYLVGGVLGALLGVAQAYGLGS